MIQDEVVKVFIVVDLVDEMIDTGWRLRSAALEWLWTDYLAVVDDQLLIEGRCRDQSSGQGRSFAGNIPYFCISMVNAASVSLIRSRRPETACGRCDANNSLREFCAVWTLLA